MDIKAFDASRAYGAALTGNGTTATSGGTPGTSAFGALVERLVDETSTSLATAESMSAGAVAGKADLVDVVTAVSNAEMVLETVTTVRDRMLSAYQEIMRMQL